MVVASRIDPGEADVASGVNRVGNALGSAGHVDGCVLLTVVERSFVVSAGVDPEDANGALIVNSPGASRSRSGSVECGVLRAFEKEPVLEAGRIKIEAGNVSGVVDAEGVGAGSRRTYIGELLVLIQEALGFAA